jgi:hypothetical protein
MTTLTRPDTSLISTAGGDSTRGPSKLVLTVLTSGAAK